MEDEKQVSNGEILAALQKLEGNMIGTQGSLTEIKSQMVIKSIFDESIGEIRSQMVTKDVFDVTIGGIKSQIDEIKSKMVTKEVFEEVINDLSDSISFIAQNAATKDDWNKLVTIDGLKEELKDFATKDDLKSLATKVEMNAMESRIITKMAEHFNVFKGDQFVAPMRGLNEKSDLTVVKLEQKKVFSKNDREEVTNIPVFAR